MSIKKRGFTLIELLVVIAIISILAGMLMPALEYAIEAARTIECINNQKQLAVGVLSFSNDMNGYLPGNVNDTDNTDPMKRDWLRGENGHSQNTATEAELKSGPHSGTIYQYIENSQVYLCPNVAAGQMYDKERGNGMFDYSMYLAFSGAKINQLPKNFKYDVGGGVYLNDFPYSLFIEERTDRGINVSAEGGFNWTDSFSPRHNNNVVMSNIDGSARTENMDLLHLYCVNKIKAQKKNGEWYSLHNMGTKFGDWNVR